MKMIQTTMSAVAAGILLSGGAVYAEAVDEAAAAKVDQAQEDVKEQTTCPVMGGKINKDLFVDVEGKRIYVCCGGCIGAVKENPDKYMQKPEEQGVTLASAETAEAVEKQCPKGKECGENCPRKKAGECMKGRGQRKGQCQHKK
jgi:hypothetical protein